MSDEMTLEQTLILIDESRQHNAAMLDRLYEALNIDCDDGEVRFKWATLAVNQVISERDTLKQQNAELAAQVEFFTSAISERFTSKESQPDGTVITDGAPWALTLLRETPAQCLLEVKAEAGRDGFVACLDYLGECDIEIGEHFEQDIHAADQYAKKISRGE